MSAEALQATAATARRRAFPAWLTRLYRGFGLSRLLGLALLLPLVALRVWDPAPIEILRLRIFDFYQTAKPREPLQQPVVIIDIDEESLAEIGQWPWPRNEVARLVDRLAAAGVVATAFDIVFAEPDRTSPEHYANALAGLAPEVAEVLRNLPSNDDLLARALRRSRVVLGESGYHRRVEGPARSESPAIPLATVGQEPTPHLFRFPALIRNTEALETAAAGRAVFNLLPGRDGVVRQVPAFVLAEGRVVPTLTVELLRVATGGNAIALKTDEAGIRSFVVAGVEVPTDRNGQLWVYYAEPRPRLYISARDLLNGSVPGDRLAGKLVLVGTSAAGLNDIKSTPLQDSVPGVEIHAQLLEMMLSGQLLLRPNYALGAELALLTAVGLLMIALVPVAGAALTLLLGTVTAGTLTAGSWLLFARQGLLIDVGYPLLGATAVFALLVATNYLREESRRQQVRSAFRQYLAPALVDQLAHDPARLVLGGESREMTVLFSDVRGFTAISEGLQDRPQELTALMNRLLTPLTAEILASGGTIDKYMGDAIMAFWNAPLDDAEHALHACEAALGMQTAVARLNESLAQELAAGTNHISRLEVGIGVNSGLCVVGNMGSDQRFDYSVLGDAVNLASRIEGQCSTYGARIVIGAATAAAVAGRLTIVEIDLIRVKGKRAPQRIYALLGGSDLAGEAEAAAAIEALQGFLTAYRGQGWDEALSILAEVESMHMAQLDLAVFARLYRGRIEAFRAEPPAADWDGVYTATSK